jgi:hypothetical protein
MAVGVDDDIADRPVGAGANGESRRSPSRTLPPESITATALSTMKPTLAIAPSLSRVISAVSPLCTNIPGATSLTGNPWLCACATVDMRAPRGARSSKRHEPCFCLSFAREQHRPLRIPVKLVCDATQKANP